VLLCDNPDNKTNECKEKSVDERMCRHRRLGTLERAVKVKYEEGKMAKEKNSSLGRRPTSKVAVEKKEALLMQGRNERYFRSGILELNIAQHASASSLSTACIRNFLALLRLIQMRENRNHIFE